MIKAFSYGGKNQQDLVPGKGLERIFTVEKVYINPGDLLRRADSFDDVQALKDSGMLQLNDIVLYDAPKDLQEGDKVLFPLNSYILMPGDQVKVVIGK